MTTLGGVSFALSLFLPLGAHLNAAQQVAKEMKNGGLWKLVQEQEHRQCRICTFSYEFARYWIGEPCVQ